MIEITSWYWLALPALLLIYELLIAGPSRRRMRRRAAAEMKLRASVKEATALVVEVVKANRTLRERLDAAEERIGQLELASSGRPYDQAINLAERGEAPERLASAFGLTMGEAKLVSLLHGQDAPGEAGQN